MLRDALRDAIEVRFRAAEQDHFGARARKRNCRFGADAAPCAGDERDLAVQAK